MSHIRPTMLAHIVYRTHQFDKMLAWYQLVFGAKIQHQNDVLAFLTFDDEHHRFALVNLGVLQPDGDKSASRNLVGVDHVAYSYSSLPDLLTNYEYLKSNDIKPYWCVHHGMTVSMYYADPDGNQMEFQVDVFDNSAQSNAFIQGLTDEDNPVGVEYDPDDWLARLREGAPVTDFLIRRSDTPISPIRGDLEM